MPDGRKSNRNPNDGNCITDEEINPPSYEEFHRALKNLKNTKTPGDDAITEKLIRHAREIYHDILYRFIVKI